MKTKVEIIKETAEFYTANPRALVEGKFGQQCCYLTSDGRQCAVGRCLENPGVLNNAYIIREEFNKAVFKPEYLGHSLNFWSYLQALHDTNTFWGETGLTEKGQEYRDHLLEIFKD